MFYDGESIFRNLILLRCVLGGETVEDITVTGISPLALANAVADKISSATVYGKCEQRNVNTRSYAGYKSVDGLTNAAGTTIETEIIDEIDDMTYEVLVKPSTGSWYIFQSRSSSSGPIYGISGSSSGNTITFSIGSVATVTSGIARDTTHTYLVRGEHRYGSISLYVKDITAGTDDTQTSTYDTSSYVASGSVMKIFGNGWNTVSAGNTLYYARAWSQGNLVLDAYPASNGSVSGLYEMMNQYLMGLTDGSVSPGSEVTAPTELVPLDIWCNNGRLAFEKSDWMPARYEVYDWIKSTAGIDLGIKTSNLTEIYANWYWEDDTKPQYLYVSDSSSAGTSNTTAYISGNGNWRFGNKTVTVSPNMEEEIGSIQSISGVEVNGDFQEYSDVGEFTSVNNLKALGTQPDPALQLYNMQVVEDGEIVLDLAAARDMYTGEFGLYETQTGRFYTNSQATITGGSSYTSLIAIFVGENTRLSVYGGGTYSQSWYLSSLLAVGNSVDSQEVIAGKLYKKTQIVGFKGDEGFTDSSLYGQAVICQNFALNNGIKPGAVLCNYYVGASDVVSTTQTLGTCFFDSNGNLYFRTNMTAAQFEEWCRKRYADGKPLYVICEKFSTYITTETHVDVYTKAGTNTASVYQTSVDGMDFSITYKGKGS